MKEGDSTVLDNSMILFASALSDGNSHNPHKLPLVLAAAAAAASRRPAPAVHGRHSAGEPVRVDAGCVRRAGGALRRQHRAAAGRAGISVRRLLCLAIAALASGCGRARRGRHRHLAGKHYRPAAATRCRTLPFSSFRKARAHREGLSRLRQHADTQRHHRRGQDRVQVVAREQDGNEINESVLRFTGMMKDGEIEITREREELRNAGNSGASFSRAGKTTFTIKRLP